MSVPPFAAAFVGTSCPNFATTGVREVDPASWFLVTMLGAFVSDKYRCRGLVSMFSFVLCIIGFSLFLGE